ncbi:MAG: UDP-N-acetylmuramoyl-tripeptide--D-alanyl-D-alanine ligase, partial [Candidatus Omnitrophica bacterium]|nr:UDP-N-acetylmuramoyl-tripeptide--D-alanyl-D-alanine ligase [Candidatus Omnitrophota bacterium]
MFKVEDLVRATKGTLLRGNLADAVKGISIDSRSIGRSFAFIAIKGDNFDGHDFVAQAIARGARAVIIKPSPATARLISSHPGISFIAVRDTVRALGDIASFHRARFNIPVICVTGSSGKTTVKEMVAHVLGLKFNVLKNEGTKNNHIGVPLTLLRISPRHKAVVLEIGTNHFGEVRNLASIARPNIGIITNIGPAHLGYFKTLAGVYIEKVTLLDCLDEPRIAVLNADDYFLSKRLPRRETRAFSLGFAIHKKSDFSASQIKLKTKSAEFVLNKRHRYILPNPGMQNIYNALSAITVARIFGLGHQDIAARLSDFILPPG